MPLDRAGCLDVRGHCGKVGRDLIVGVAGHAVRLAGKLEIDGDARVGRLALARARQAIQAQFDVGADHRQTRADAVDLVL